MQYRQLGHSDLRVSVAGLGCNGFARTPGRGLDQAETDAVVGAALDAGITLFDTARRYGDGNSEVYLGRALGSRRDEAIIATKFGLELDPDNGGSRAYITKAVETSLRALGTDRIDLYQLHTPDPATPIAETLGALDELVDQGKIRHYGSSNLLGWQLADAHWTAATAGLRGFVSAQNEWSLLHRQIETEVVPACEHFGLGILPYFPLASGLLTGKIARDEAPHPDSRLAHAPPARRLLTEGNFDVVEAVDAWARAHGRSLLEVALSWLASQAVVSSVISGAMTPEQVRQNVQLTKTDLTAEEVAEVRSLLGGI